MKVQRAHSYAAVEAVRHELTRLPPQWAAAIAHVPWLVLPDDLSPLYVGLMEREVMTHDGRRYSECGAWCARVGDNMAGFGASFPPPHIYLPHRSVEWSVHEAAHAIEAAWCAPIDDLYRPDLALYEYMGSTPQEYFACALDAFLTPERDTGRWNAGDLAARDERMWRYLKSRIEGGD